MKKVLALACALVMLVGLATPAMGEETGKSLEEITLSVKEALDISDDYDNFQSNNYNGNWDLSWTGTYTNIYVTASSEGDILSYYFYDNNYSYEYTSKFVPRYPSVRKAEIVEKAEEFLGRVTGADEKWTLEEVTESLQNDYSTNAYVSGRLIIDEIPTDIAVNVTVDLENMRVTSYYRGDSYMKFLSKDGDTTINISEAEARALLKEKTGLTLKYYAANEGETAKLVYIRDRNGNYIVRALDGEVLNVDDIYSTLNGGDARMPDMGMYGDSAAPQEAERQLTEAELAGISVYKDALSASQLDEIARSITEFGITEDYALTTVNFYNNPVIGSLTYSRRITDDELKEYYGLSGDEIAKIDKSGNGYFMTKNISLDATTGELDSMYTSYPYIYGSYEKEEGTEEHRALADAFLEKYFPEIFNSIELSTESNYGTPYYYSPTMDYYFVRVHNGFKFDGNYINVTVNAKDGTIDGFYKYWNMNQEFEEADVNTLISADEAYEKFIEQLTFEAAFISVPTQNNYGEYTYERVLAWHYVEDYNNYGVDAKTGEVLKYGYAANAQYTYSDIEGIPQQEAIEELARFGIGFGGGSFEPESAFTVRDMLELILMADGYREIENWDFSEIVNSARNMGAPDFTGADPDAPVMKVTFASMLIDMYGWGDAASIKGIYKCGFADDDTIDAEQYGFIALAYGMGLIAPDAENNIAIGAELTRAEGAQILHNFLGRDN